MAAEIIPIRRDMAKDSKPTRRKTPKQRAEERGTRVPDPFPLDDVRAWFRARYGKVPRRVVEDEHEKFMDHWCGVPGWRGRKLEWAGTWRNWMKKAEQDWRSPLGSYLRRVGWKPPAEREAERTPSTTGREALNPNGPFAE